MCYRICVGESVCMRKTVDNVFLWFYVYAAMWCSESSSLKKKQDWLVLRVSEEAWCSPLQSLVGIWRGMEGTGEKWRTRWTVHFPKRLYNNRDIFLSVRFTADCVLKNICSYPASFTQPLEASFSGHSCTLLETSQVCWSQLWFKDLFYDVQCDFCLQQPNLHSVNPACYWRWFLSNA